MFKISAPKFFSLLLSVTPFIFRWLYGSWIVTRQIVPAKGVFWGFMSSATIYMIVEMYMEKKLWQPRCTNGELPHHGNECGHFICLLLAWKRNQNGRLTWSSFVFIEGKLFALFIYKLLYSFSYGFLYWSSCRCQWAA